MECKINNLLVGFDFSENGHRAVASAVSLARKTGAVVRVMTALPHHIDGQLVKQIEASKGTHPSKLIDRAIILERAEAKMKEALQDIDTAGVKLICEAEYRSYPKAIIVTADLYNPDMIIVGATAAGLNPSMLVGTDSERLARKSRWPVLVSRVTPISESKRILCPVDFSSASERALGWALELASISGAELEVITILDGFEGLEVFLDAGLDITEYRQEQYAIAREQLDALLQRFSADAKGVKVTASVLEGVPHQVIIEHALRSSADLISLGSLGRSGVMEVLIGGTSERVLRALPCSVLLVKPDEFVLEFSDKV
jgi:universal stress protein E